MGRVGGWEVGRGDPSKFVLQLLKSWNVNMVEFIGDL